MNLESIKYGKTMNHLMISDISNNNNNKRENPIATVPYERSRT